MNDESPRNVAAPNQQQRGFILNSTTADGNFAGELSAGRVKLSVYNEPKYNAIEAKGHETGYMGSNKPRASVVWSVYEVNGTTAKCQNINAWGAVINETRELRQLDKLEPTPAFPTR